MALFNGSGIGIEPSHDALDIAVDRGGASIESDGGNGRRGIGANTGQRTQSSNFAREFAGMSLDHDAGAGMQVAGARVIAESLPELQNLVERGCGQRPNIGPTCHESVEIWADSRHRRLLQHDLAEPDAVGIGLHSGRRPPRQIAAMAVVPGKQRCGIGHSRR